MGRDYPGRQRETGNGMCEGPRGTERYPVWLEHNWGERQVRLCWSWIKFMSYEEQGVPGSGLCFNCIVPLDAVEVSGLKVTEE